VVIGSRLIQLIEGQSAQAAKAAAQEFMAGIRQSLDA